MVSEDKIRATVYASNRVSGSPWMWNNRGQTTASEGKPWSVPDYSFQSLLLDLIPLVLVLHPLRKCLNVVTVHTLAGSDLSSKFR